MVQLHRQESTIVFIATSRLNTDMAKKRDARERPLSLFLLVSEGHVHKLLQTSVINL